MDTLSNPPTDTNQQASRAEVREKGPPFWEWVAAGLGSLFLLATLGYLAYDALADKPGSPVPYIQVTAVEKQDKAFLIHLRVHNAGKPTAAGLRVVGVLRRDGQGIERSDVEFQFVPGESWREGGLFFTRDPSRFDLELRAEGFHNP